MNALQTAIFQFPADQLRIDLIGLGMLLLALAMDISRVGHQGTPTVALETTVGMIATATCLVGHTYFVAREMFCNVVQQLSGIGRHTKGLATEQFR